MNKLNPGSVASYDLRPPGVKGRGGDPLLSRYTPSHYILYSGLDLQ